MKILFCLATLFLSSCEMSSNDDRKPSAEKGEFWCSSMEETSVTYLQNELNKWCDKSKNFSTFVSSDRRINFCCIRN